MNESATVPRSSTTTTTDEDGKITETTITYDEYDKPISYKVTTTDENGKITTETTIDYDTCEPISCKVTIKDENGKITETTIDYDTGEPISCKVTIKDENGKITKETTTNYDKDGNKKEMLIKEYENGKITTETKTDYDKDGKPISCKETTKDENGNITEKTTTNDNKGKPISCKETTKDENGNTTEETTTNYDKDKDGVIKQMLIKEYENGKITKETMADYDENGKKKQTIKAEYSNNNQKITTTCYDDLEKPISGIHQEYTGNEENTEAYRSATFNKDGTCTVKDKNGNIIKYNTDPSIDIHFYNIHSNGTPDITNTRTKLLCEAINKTYNKEIAGIYESIIDKKSIDAVINDKLKDNHNQVLSLVFDGHQVCVVKIGGKLFNVGMFEDMYKPDPNRYPVTDITLKQSSRNGSCVNLADIMLLFASKWINQRNGENPETAAEDFEKDINKFAKEYRNEKLYDWYAQESLALRAWIPLPDFVEKKLKDREDFVEKNLKDIDKHSKLSDDDKEKIEKHKILNGGSKPNHHGFLGNVAVTEENGNTQDDSVISTNLHIKNDNKTQDDSFISISTNLQTKDCNPKPMENKTEYFKSESSKIGRRIKARRIKAKQIKRNCCSIS